VDKIAGEAGGIKRCSLYNRPGAFALFMIAVLLKHILNNIFCMLKAPALN
jgi:hypothetical protein